MKIDAVECSLTPSVWVMQTKVEILKTQNSLWLMSSWKYTEKSPNIRDTFCAPVLRHSIVFLCVMLLEEACHRGKCRGGNTHYEVQVFHRCMLFGKWQPPCYFPSNIMLIEFLLRQLWRGWNGQELFNTVPIGADGAEFLLSHIFSFVSKVIISDNQATDST